MKRSTVQILGCTISGDMAKADERTLVPAVPVVIEAQGSVSVLFDLTDFQWEKNVDLAGGLTSPARSGAFRRDLSEPKRTDDPRCHLSALAVIA